MRSAPQPLAELSEAGVPAALAEVADRRASESAACFHCGAPCRAAALLLDGRSFCCAGCRTVFELLAEHGLEDFYSLAPAAGVRAERRPAVGAFGFLDEPAVRARFVDFTDEHSTRVTFRLPAIHCIACVWLLENLFRMHAGIGRSVVNFPRREVAITFADTQVRLSEIATLLASLGYEPELNFADVTAGPPRAASRRLWLQLGLAGFAFGNIMLFSLSTYFGLDAFSRPVFQRLFGLLSFALVTPVVFYSAADYWRAAWVSLRRRLLTIDVPIAAGLAALFGESIFEVWSGRGEGYFDSLAGLIFFLLCGKWFQQKTFDRLAFDRDYTSFFPLAVTRLVVADPGSPAEERVALSQLAVGDRLLIRNGELIPADARLVAGAARIDYSFVTGEAEPVTKQAGQLLFAGGRQLGGAVEVELVKPVSQGYLTSLWNQDIFRKGRTATLDTLTNRYSRRFTKLVLVVAVGAALFWAWADPSRSIKSFTSVLIVACPCALALAAPFALGTAQRALGRRGIYLKNPTVVETLARVDTVVFDKTGTLTAAGAGGVKLQGPALDAPEEAWIAAVARQSTHPCAVRLAAALRPASTTETVRSFREQPGGGMSGMVHGREMLLGSLAWLAEQGIAINGPDVEPRGSIVGVAIDGEYRGGFELAGALRPATDRLIRDLAARYELALLSGDNERERARFRELFGAASPLHFNQSPLDKLDFIRRLQRDGGTVLMVGDGLNDAGALRQSDAGLAVVENIGAFSPASDLIVTAGQVSQLAGVLRFAKRSVRVVRWSFLISSLYNVVGLAIAASGNLSPIVCAILMPLSSVTVVVFACGATEWAARRSLPEHPDERAALP